MAVALSAPNAAGTEASPPKQELVEKNILGTDAATKPLQIYASRGFPRGPKSGEDTSLVSWEAAGRQGAQALLISSWRALVSWQLPTRDLGSASREESEQRGWRQAKAEIPQILELQKVEEERAVDPALVTRTSAERRWEG